MGVNTEDKEKALICVTYRYDIKGRRTKNIKAIPCDVETFERSIHNDVELSFTANHTVFSVSSKMGTSTQTLSKFIELHVKHYLQNAKNTINNTLARINEYEFKLPDITSYDGESINLVLGFDCARIWENTTLTEKTHYTTKHKVTFEVASHLCMAVIFDFQHNTTYYEESFIRSSATKLLQEKADLINAIK